MRIPWEAQPLLLVCGALMTELERILPQIQITCCHLLLPLPSKIPWKPKLRMAGHLHVKLTFSPEHSLIT